jgi:hypothetical protein
MGFIYNDNAVKMEEIITKDYLNLLNYNKRICKHCGLIFEIKEQGIFYWCGCKK